MRTSPPLVFLLVVLFFAVPAQAAKWQPIGGKTRAAQTRNEVDAASVSAASDGKVRLWHREIHAKAIVPESGAFSFTRLTMLTEFECAKRTAALVQRIYTAADGNELANESFSAPDAQPVAPDSTLETVMNFACQHSGKPQAGATAPATPAATAPAATAAAAPPPQAPSPPVVDAKEPAKKLKKGEMPPPHVVHWSYAGATGPDKWSSLDKDFATCGEGQRQSPIDIRHSLRADLPPIRFDYKPVALAIVDNGHSIRVDTADAGGITVDGESYALQQFHFHRPSEEKINGKAYALVAHLVHRSASGRLAVVAVLFEAGKEQKLIRTLWNNLPLEQDKPVIRSDVKIDPGQILPVAQGYYTFLGSLTTPPCSENVLWLVLKTPVQVSKDQLAGFATLYKNNVRPTQPVNGRLIKESR